MIPQHKMIKMRALDTTDLHHIAEQLRDGLCPMMAMVHERKSFTLLVNRFCWNHEEKADGTLLHFRSHVGLLFRHVQKVQRKGFEQHSKDRILNLLHIELRQNTKDTWVHLVFSKGYEIRLLVEKLEAYLSDLHDPWPTRSKPMHLHEHLEAMIA